MEWNNSPKSVLVHTNKCEPSEMVRAGQDRDPKTGQTWCVGSGDLREAETTPGSRRPRVSLQGLGRFPTYRVTDHLSGNPRRQVLCKDSWEPSQDKTGVEPIYNKAKEGDISREEGKGRRCRASRDLHSQESQCLLIPHVWEKWSLHPDSKVQRGDSCGA